MSVRHPRIQTIICCIMDMWAGSWVKSGVSVIQNHMPHPTKCIEGQRWTDNHRLLRFDFQRISDFLLISDINFHDFLLHILVLILFGPPAFGVDEVDCTYWCLGTCSPGQWSILTRASIGAQTGLKLFLWVCVYVLWYWSLSVQPHFFSWHVKYNDWENKMRKNMPK